MSARFWRRTVTSDASQAWLAAHPGWDVVPDQNLDDDEETAELETEEAEKATEEGEKKEEEEGEGPSEPTVKTHAVDDEYKKAEGEANYYRCGRTAARVPSVPFCPLRPSSPGPGIGGRSP